MKEAGFSIGAMVVGLFIGLLIGAGAMMMFAPKSGEEVRRDIRQTAQDVRSKAEDTISDVRNKAEDTAQDVRTRAQGTMQNY